MRGAIPLLVLQLATATPASAEEAPAAAEGNPPPGPEMFPCREGPWGSLEYYHTFLEAPDFLIESMPTPAAGTVWHLPGMSREEQRGILEDAGLLPSQIDASLGQTDLARDIARIYPPAEVVSALPPEVRGRLYRTLRDFPANRFHRVPLVIDSGDVRDWFRGSHLSETALSLIEQLSYPLGQARAFSDVPLLLQSLDEGERMERAVLRALTRTRTLVLRLRVDPDSDLGAIAQYWTGGDVHGNAFPLLDSISRSSGVDHLDAVHLLPPLPRQHLYTYPSLSEGLDGTFPDSFWAALNFFEYLPRDEFKDLREVERYAEMSYVPAEMPLRFGDQLVVFDRETNEAIKAATFIADDIVYTKRGRSVHHPYILTRLPDLLSRYQGEVPFEVRAWRRKDS